MPEDRPDDSAINGLMGGCGNHPCVYFELAPQVLSLFLTPAGFALATAVGDFNGDGIPDVAAATETGLYVYLGNGDGTFKPAIAMMASFAPIALATGDFNNDGKLDLVMGNNSIPQTPMLLLLGNGDGTFQSPSSIAPAGFNPTVGDFNDDGNLDVVAWDGSANLDVYLGNGLGGFTQSATIPVPGIPSIAVGQINHDHKLDMAVTSENQMLIYLGNGDGTFGPPSEIPVDVSSRSVAIHNVNGDENNDVIVVGSLPSGADEIVVLLGNGDGTFQPPISSSVPTSVNSFAIADFNSDGKPDIAVVGVVGYVLLGAGDGTFPNAVQYPLIGSFFSSVIVSDLNGDHEADLVLGGMDMTPSQALNFVSILLGKGNASFRGPPDVSLGAAPASIAVADFNGDGIPDFATPNQNPSSLSVALGNGDGFFNAPSMVSLSFSPHLVAAGDFNGDGRIDLVVSSTIFGNPTLAILLGDGTGGFQAPMFIPGYFDSVAAIALGDVNNDGKLDIVVPGAVFLGNGDGTFRAPITLAATRGAQSLALGDFNADGKLDLAAGEGSLRILLGNGNGTFTPDVTVPVSNGTSTLVIADFNADGNLDVAVAGGYQGVSVFLGDGDGNFQPELVSSSSLFVLGSLVAADFNLDGKLDLALLSQDSVSFLAGNEDGTFAEAQIFPVELSPSGMAEGTLDSTNTKPGLVVANAGSNTVSVLANVTKRP